MDIAAQTIGYRALVKYFINLKSVTTTYKTSVDAHAHQNVVK